MVNIEKSKIPDQFVISIYQLAQLFEYKHIKSIRVDEKGAYIEVCDDNESIVIELGKISGEEI